MVSIVQVTDPIQIAVAQELVSEYFSWFFALIPGSESDPTFRGWEDELEPIPGACELKRLFVRPVFRGQSVGKHLIDAFMQSARELGYKFAVLDSHISMAKAHDIYRKSGFKVIDVPPDFPDEWRKSVIFMKCAL